MEQHIQSAHGTWASQLKDYRTTKIVDTDCRAQCYRPPRQVLNPINHQFIRKDDEDLYNKAYKKLETQALNAARDVQLSHEHAFDFVTQVDRYYNIDPKQHVKIEKLKEYRFKQPHVRDIDYKDLKVPLRDIEQRKSTQLKETFQNVVNPKLPIFGGKLRDFPYKCNGKPNPAPDMFEIGYDDHYQEQKNFRKHPEKKHWGKTNKLVIGYTGMDQ